MEKKAVEIIKDAKRIKSEAKVTYENILEQMEELDPSTVISRSTLRRIFREGSEAKASSFNYEEILVPVDNAMQALSKKPKPASERDHELEAYKAIIRVQDEEIDRLMDINKLLQDRVEFLVKQVDNKDQIISQLIEKALK
jgi:uncharacterized protein (DUF3084 family)